MACSIDATPGGASANSYATIQAADDYHAAHLEFDVWDDLDATQKCQALQQATRVLDAQVTWNGWPASSTQALAWPRSGVLGRNGYVLDGTTIPAQLGQATAELARLLAVRSLDTAAQLADDTAGFKKMKAGPVEIEYDRSAASARLESDVIGDDVFYLLTGLGVLRRRGMGSIPLVRV